jgi:hypothetical protein
VPSAALSMITPYPSSSSSAWRLASASMRPCSASSRPCEFMKIGRAPDRHLPHLPGFYPALPRLSLSSPLLRRLGNLLRTLGRRHRNARYRPRPLPDTGAFMGSNQSRGPEIPADQRHGRSSGQVTTKESSRSKPRNCFGGHSGSPRQAPVSGARSLTANCGQCVGSGLSSLCSRRRVEW